MIHQTDNPTITDAEALLQAMTLEEQVSLLAGASFWLTVPVERLGNRPHMDLVGR